MCPLRARRPTSERCSDFEHATSKSDFEDQCSIFEHRTSKSEFGLDFNVRSSGSNIEVRSRNFGPKLQCSVFLLPSPLPRASHPLSFLLLFFVFFFFFLLFFSTPNFKARLQNSNFELRSWNFEPRLQCSMFPPRPPLPRQPPTICSIFSFFSFSFLCFSSTPNFEAKLQCSIFKLRSWNFEVWVQNSNFELGTSLGTPWPGPSSVCLPSLYLRY